MGLIKIAEVAQYEEITKEAIWEHFVEVTIPAIRHWQLLEEEADVSHELGALLLKVVSSVSHISEVSESCIQQIARVLIIICVYHQVLRFVNPDVAYHPPASSGHSQFIAGVAINLNSLIDKLDEMSIPHSTSRIMRRSLDKHALTSGKQHFLTERDMKERATYIDRRRKTDCRAAICVPRQTIPDEFFTYFPQGICV